MIAVYGKLPDQPEVLLDKVEGAGNAKRVKEEWGEVMGIAADDSTLASVAGSDLGGSSSDTSSFGGFGGGDTDGGGAGESYDTSGSDSFSLDSGSSFDSSSSDSSSGGDF